MFVVFNQLRLLPVVV